MFLLARFSICKTSVKDSYFSKVAGFFLATFSKINTLTGIFKGFYLAFKQAPIVSTISRRLSDSRFRKFQGIFLETKQ